MIKVSDLNKSYNKLPVLKNISFEVKKGEIVAIIGPSGAGKSTLLKIIGSLENSDSGDILINGINTSMLSNRDISQFRNKEIGFVFQFHHLLPEFTALENIMLPALIAGVEKKKAEIKAMELLKMFSLGDRASHKPSQLSGGEAQRVAISRAIMNSPSLLLADEPSGNLDSIARKELHNIFFELREKLGLTIVVVTHDENLANMSDRKIELLDGNIV